MNDKNDTNIFQPIIQELLDKDIAKYGPESFQQYGRKHQFDHLKSKTAQYISVDFIERLNPALKTNDAMIFRLGTSTDGRTTNFAVIKVKNHLKDFFFFDNDVFSSNELCTFLPSTSMKKFYPFLLLPWRSESSLLNLGLASGLIGHALNLDCVDETIVPATTQSSFSFKFNPHPLIDCELIHQNGQVEIDAIFVEKRNNRDCLFLLEAKSGSETSIAKHKILYPVLALYNEVPNDMPIIPVYVKIQEQNDGIIYNIAECEISDPRKSKTYISDLAIKNFSSYYLPIPLKNKY